MFFDQFFVVLDVLRRIRSGKVMFSVRNPNIYCWKLRDTKVNKRDVNDILFVAQRDVVKQSW